MWLNAAGDTEPTSCVRLITPSVVARQPPMTGESSSTTPRASSGCRAAAIRLRKPPSEWPTRNAGSPVFCTSSRAKSARWLTSPGQLLLTV